MNIDLKLGLVKTNSQGVTQWTKSHGGLNGLDVGFGICTTDGDGFGLTGFTRSFGAGSSDLYLLNTDSLGDTLNNYIVGNVFYDLDETCDSTTNDLD